jgi:hypothetical protein
VFQQGAAHAQASSVVRYHKLINRDQIGRESKLRPTRYRRQPNYLAVVFGDNQSHRGMLLHRRVDFREAHDRKIGIAKLGHKPEGCVKV